MAEHQVLFCPFCRESFEQQTRCPEHELNLVTFAQLGPDPTVMDEDLELPPGSGEAMTSSPRSLPFDDRPLPTLDPGRGRGLVALGALLNLVALGLPLLQDSEGATAISVYRLARTVPSLWTVLLVSFTLLFALARRRTPRRLRSLRVLVPLLALLSPLTLAWGIVRLIGMSGTVDIALGSAVYVVVGASLLVVIGGIGLGGRASHDTQPAAAVPNS